VTSAVTTTMLTRRFGSLTAVDQVTLEVDRGEVFGLVGPNGAGKTTLIRLLSGIYTPSDGSATVLGFDIAVDRRRIRQHIGYQSQAFSLYGELTVDENLHFYAEIYGGIDHGRIDDVCGAVGLDGADRGQRSSELSTGIRQRAALAAAILHRPQLVFLDEPTSGVDPAGRRDLWAFIRTLAREGTTFVVSTHVMSEAERCDRLALMSDGRVLDAGSPADLRHDSGITVVQVEAEPWQTAYERLKHRWPAVTLQGTKVRLPAPTGSDLAAAIVQELRGLRVRAVENTPPTLEDTFIWRIHHVTGAGSPPR